MNRSSLKNSKRIVVKVGTSTVTHPSGKPNLQRMDKLSRDLADLRLKGLDVVLVSSGAVGAGMGKLGVTERPSGLPMKQALAAVGQGLLMQMYEKFFGEYGITVAQVLLTRDAFYNRSRYLNICNTLRTLLEMDIIPIINENDTVAVDEIKFGDNDTLSALVACAVEADLLIILSDIDGLYDSDPRLNPDAKLLPYVEAVSEDVRANSSSKGSSTSSGGMYTKLSAADIALPVGIPLVIARGDVPDILYKILDGNEIGTLFSPGNVKRNARKQWIASGDKPQGTILIDDGAVKALKTGGSSLLPKGILSVEGYFERGKLVSISNSQGKEIARGLVNYSSSDARKIAGHKTAEIENILGVKDYDEVIHRDNLVIS